MLNRPWDYPGPITTALLTPSGAAQDLRSLWCSVILGKLFPFYPFPLMGAFLAYGRCFAKLLMYMSSCHLLTAHPAQPFQDN